MARQRLIGWVTALLAALCCCLPAAARTKYPIHRDFLLISRFSAPTSRFSLDAGNAFLTAMPKWVGHTEGVEVHREQMEDGVKGWLITPLESRDPSRCILFIHGGGFVFKASMNHYSFAAEYARKTGCDVFFIDYTMAYKADYGFPLTQCLTALNVLQGWYGTVSVTGDSAGGFLALKTALEAPEKPDRLCLVYPVVDCSMRTESMAKYTDTPLWNAVNNRKMWENYLQGNTETSLLDMDLTSLPPTYVETAEFDCLHDEGVLLAERLRASGVPVVLHETHGTVHGYDFVQRSSITQESLRQRIAFLSE